MNRNMIGAVGAALVLLLLLVLISPAAPIQDVEAARPTTVPTYVGVPGDKVTKSEGGVFNSGIAIEGDEDEVQLYIKPYVNATASVLEIVNADATPVFYIDDEGNLTSTGTGTFASSSSSFTQTISLAVPTAIATQTPGLYISSLSVGKIVEIADASTPVWSILNGGAVLQTGKLTNEGATDLTSLDASTYILVGEPTPAAIPTWSTGDLVIKDALEVQGISHVAGVANMTGGADLAGTKIDLDADNDTSIAADTDDQIDIELEGADTIVLKAVAGIDAGATTNIIEIAGTTPVDTAGTQEHNFLNIDMTIGDSTAGTNTVNAIRIDDITGDAQVTESGVIVGTGFDVGLDLSGTPLDLDVDNDTSVTASTDDQIDFEIGGADIITFYDAGDAGSSSDLIDITDAVNIMSSDTFIGIDMNLTNADHTGTSYLYGMDIVMTGDADAETTEIGYRLGGAWDTGIDFNGATLTDEIVLQGGETIENATDGSIKFTDDGGNVLATIVDAGTTGRLDMTGGADLQGGDLILQNDKRIVNSTASTINFTDGSNSLFTIVDAGSAGNATSTGTFTADGQSTLSGAVVMESTLDVQGGSITLENDEVIDNSADATIAFTDGTNTLFSIVDAGTTGNGDFSGTLTVDGASTLTGDVVVSGTAVVDDLFELDPATITLTADDGTLNCLTSNCMINPDGDYGTADITIKAAGTILIIQPIDQSTVISDTGIMKLSGNCTLTVNDTLTMVSDGTYWNEIACTDNG